MAELPFIHYRNIVLPFFITKQQSLNRMGSKQNSTVREWCSVNNRPDLIEQWAVEKNNQIGLSLDKPVSFTRTKAFWKCPDYPDHLYDMLIYQRTKLNQNCPICSGKRVLKGFNDLAKWCKDAVTEWDYGNNWDKKKKKQLTPFDVTYGSHYIANFVCSKCHEPFSMMVKTYYRGNRCKYCAHTEVRPDGSNSFAAEHPDQLKYWDYEKNDKVTTKEHPNGVRPEEILSSSNIRLHWKCGFGHTWRNDACSQRNGCSRCNRRRKFSDSEKTVAYYVEKMFGEGEIIDNYHPDWNKKQDLDIYIPSKAIAIQYDGVPHDQSRYKTDLKNGIEVVSHGIKLIRIREKDTPFIDDGSLEIRRNGTGVTDESLNDCIRQLLQLLSDITGVEYCFEVNRDKDLSNIVSRSYTIELSNSISVKRPDLVPYIANDAEHPQNRDVLSRLPVSHNGKIWWACPKCNLDHHIVVGSVTGKPVDKFPCVVKTGKIAVEGTNDFESQYPELMKDWDWNKNKAHGIDPKKLTKGSDKGPFYWKCHNCGCKWSTNTLHERTRKDATGCPDCYAKKRKDRGRNNGAKYTVQYLQLIRDNPGITAKEIQSVIGTSIGSIKSKLGDMVEKEEISYEKVRKNKSGPESFTYSITDKGRSIIDSLTVQELSELSKKDITKRAPKMGINDLPTWCVSHNRTLLLDEWSSENSDKPEDHIASDEDIVKWKCNICNHVWSCSISYRTLGKHDCGDCFQRSKREIEYICLQYIRDNPNTSGQVLATSLNKNLFFVLNKLKVLTEEGKLIRTKTGRAYFYSITDNGVREIEIFSKLLEERGPHFFS